MGRDPLERIVALMTALKDRVIVQLREKDLPARELYEWTAVLSITAAQTGARLMINARADVARCFAPHVGLHLPEDGMPLADARALLPPGTLIGRSIHAATHEDADLFTIAPVFATPSKPGSKPLEIDGLREVLRSIPARAEVYALGGIDRSNAEAVCLTTVNGIAAIRAAWSGELLQWTETT